MGDKIIGNKTTIKVVKNKVAPPFRTALVDIMYGEGVSKEGELIDLASEVNILEKSGAWYAYKGEKLGQGKENVKLFLKEHPQVFNEVNKKVREHYQISKPETDKKPEGSK